MATVIAETGMVVTEELLPSILGRDGILRSSEYLPAPAYNDQ